MNFTITSDNNSIYSWPFFDGKSVYDGKTSSCMWWHGYGGVVCWIAWCTQNNCCFTTSMLFYASGSNDRGILFLSCVSVCLSVCLSVVIRYNFWMVRDRELTFGMYTPLMMPFRLTPKPRTLLHQSQWLCDLDFDLYPKNCFFRLCCRRKHSVSQKHMYFFFRTFRIKFCAAFTSWLLTFVLKFRKKLQIYFHLCSNRKKY